MRFYFFMQQLQINSYSVQTLYKDYLKIVTELSIYLFIKGAKPLTLLLRSYF